MEAKYLGKVPKTTKLIRGSTRIPTQVVQPKSASLIPTYMTLISSRLSLSLSSKPQTRRVADTEYKELFGPHCPEDFSFVLKVIIIIERLESLIMPVAILKAMDD